jgi:hypothetical protein
MNAASHDFDQGFDHLPHSTFKYSAGIGLSSFTVEAACRLVANDFPDPYFSIRELPAT